MTISADADSLEISPDVYFGMNDGLSLHFYIFGSMDKRFA
eukprot:CAMPEP_0194088994 /NCGR_PEP_ID=MMETSP0149-20130528/32121_1 /TAXON_ID=122233 /ORGANISM="Chaetoceros debilis, Strain MM31A-1" /LENGTH=39 /DNA_ID= /DNA_START= /DNA_END= /DNA_ORIENTATION=